MKDRRSPLPDELPLVPLEALRDHGESEAVNRIWRRLDENVADQVAMADEPPRGRATGPGGRLPLLWAPVLVAAGFALGLWVQAPASSEGPVAAAERPSHRSGGPRRRPAVRPEPAEDARDVDEARSLRRRDRATPRRTRARAPAVPMPVVASGDAAPRATAPGVEPTAPSPVVVAKPRWQALFEQGDWTGARKALDAEGGIEAYVPRANADQLMALVDLALAAGRSAVATRALRRVLADFSSNGNAPVAALRLGNLLKRAGDKRGADEAFARYRALSRQGEFAEDALSERVALALQAGKLAEAERLFQQYEKEYPQGARLAELKARLQQARERLARGADAGSSGSAGDDAPADADVGVDGGSPDAGVGADSEPSDADAGADGRGAAGAAGR